MRGSTRAARHAAAFALVAVLTACSSDPSPEAAKEPRDDTPAGAVATPASSGSPSEADPSSDQHTHGLEVPDTSSGPLTRRDFPTPRQLGPDWSYRVDTGDPEEGYSGNSTPVLERDPTEVAMLAVPFGCPRPVDLPVPEHALEVDYTAAGAVPVIAVRASFGDPRTASRFFGTRTRLLDSCQGTAASEAEGVLVREVRRLSGTALLSDRTPDSDPWTELAVHDGDQVVLVAVRARLDERPLTPATLDDVVRAFRR